MTARDQFLLDLHDKLIVDLFAGGGGMSLAFERAFGRSPDVAVNHDDDALSMHRMNHPQTRHFVADVFEVCPQAVTQGRPVGWLHGSPDCTHHSQAAGGQPRSKKIRGLGWVLPRWAGQVRPEVISMENVKQMLKWGPLVAKRDPETGRCLKRVVDERGRTLWAVAEKGERVPVQNQYLVPDKAREGVTWRRFVGTFRAMGYAVDWRVRCAADAGGHTTRTRLFLIARRDGRPIVFPPPSFFKAPGKGQRRWKAAAECIDFTLPCRSIFDRPRPLAEATMKRIATGIRKFVLESAQPFIVPVTHSGGENRAHSVADPFRTVTAAHRGEFAVVAPVMVQTGYGEREGQSPRTMDIEQPLGTIVGTGKHAVAAAYLMQANDGFCATVGRALSDPITTITNSGSQQQLVAASLLHLRRNCDGRGVGDPLMTVSAAGQHHALIECTLSATEEAGALRVAAFLMRYYGQGGQWSGLEEPMSTITTKDRMALVTVTISGTPYVIVDIGLRMLEPRELYRAQDFPDDYIIDRGHDGRAFSKSAQVRMVGNSVNPVDAAAFIEANAPWLAVRRSA